MSDDPDGTTNTKDTTGDVTEDSGFNEGTARVEPKVQPHQRYFQTNLLTRLQI